MIYATGISHETVESTALGKYGLAGDKCSEAESGVLSAGIADEMLLLSTCNRVEMYLVSADAEAAAKADGLFQNAQEVGGVKIFTMFLTGTSTDAVRKMCDKARDTVSASVTAIIGECEGKTTLAVAVGKEAQSKGLAAGKLAKQIAAVAGGNGGGKPDFAMAGIRDTSKIDEALAAVPGIVKETLEA